MESFPATDAKKEYFLTTEDLLNVPYKSEYWGFGSDRPTKWYKCSDLEAAALERYGAEELAKKRARREKRTQNQIKKQQAAFKAEEELKKLQKKSEENAAPNPTATLVSAKTLQNLRKDITKAFKPLITWDYLRSRNSPHGCNAVVHIPRVQQAEYAALIGRPADPNLTSVVKSGASYSVDVEFSIVMNNNEPIMGKGGRHGCNRQLGINPNSHLTMKYKPIDSTLSVTGYVQHVDTFDYDY